MKRFLLVLVGLILGSVCFINLLHSNGSQFAAIAGTLLFGGGAIFFLFQDRFDAWTSARNEQRIKNKYCRFDETCITFPEGYYFDHGYLKNKKVLPYELINEIRINTFPATAIINHNEVIFLGGADKETCKNIALAKKIPIGESTDNWSLICEEFLDTEHEEDYKRSVLLSLEKNGIPKEETVEIRNRISKRMMMLTVLSWEWIYYGQYDVLKQLWPLTETRYWWTMEIALRKENEV